MMHQNQTSRGLLAAKITSREDAKAVAESLIDIDNLHSRDPFFTRAACLLVTEAIVSLHTLSPGTWRLKDLANTLRSPDLLRKLLNTTREGRSVLRLYFSDAPTESVCVVSKILFCCFEKLPF